MTREELIAALERAEGPSDALDEGIHGFINGRQEGKDTWRHWDECGSPAYSASIDAALTLVPEGWDWCVARISGKWDAQVGEADTFMAEGAGSNASPAIALCVAALKARA